MQALTHSGGNSNGRLFTKPALEQLHAPQFRCHEKFVGVTHGFFESYTSAEADCDVHLRTIGHGGNMDGYRCALTIVPARKLGVFCDYQSFPRIGRWSR